MINKFQISIILFVYLIYLVSHVAPDDSSGSTDENKNLESQRDFCIAKAGIDPYKLDQETYHKLIQENDHKLGCFMACAMKAGGTINQDDTINEKIFKPEELKKIKKCLEKKSLLSKGADECLVAITIVQCTIY